MGRKIGFRAESTLYLNAVVAIEAQNPPEFVASAFARWLQRWPKDRALLMEYGNMHYASDELAEAAKQFTAPHHDLHYTPAYNTLAHIQPEEKHHAAAIRSVHIAIELGRKLFGYLTANFADHCCRFLLIPACVRRRIELDCFAPVENTLLSPF